MDANGTVKSSVYLENEGHRDHEVQNTSEQSNDGSNKLIQDKQFSTGVVTERWSQQKYTLEESAASSAGKSDADGLDEQETRLSSAVDTNVLDEQSEVFSTTEVDFRGKEPQQHPSILQTSQLKGPTVIPSPQGRRKG